MFKRIFKALFALVFGQILTRFGSFILVPLFTKYWSPTIYGEWLTLSATVAYIASLDFGVNQAAINRLTQLYAKGNLEEYKTIQHSALKFFFIIAVIGFLLFAVLLGIIPINNLLGIVSTSSSEASFTLLILSAYILTSLPARMIFSIYQTTGNLAKTQWIKNSQSVIFILAAVLILLNGYGMIYVASIQFLLQIAAVIYVLIDTKLNFPELFPGIEFSESKVMKELFKPGLFFMFILFANIIWYQGSILLVSTVYGGLLVATFSVTRTLSLLPRQIVSILYVSVFPDIAILKGKEDYKMLKLIHRLLIIISTGLAIVFFSIFWFNGENIILLWTLGTIKTDSSLLRALLILVLLQTPYLASVSISLATNQHKFFTILFFSSQIAGIIISILSIKAYGLTAIPIAFLVAETLFCFYFIIKDTCKRIGENFNDIFLSILFNSSALLIFNMITLFFIPILFNYSVLINVIFSTIISISITILYIWFGWLKDKEKRFLKQRFNIFVKRT